MMTVQLPPDIARFVDDAVASGRYASADDVFRAAVQALEEREHQFAALWADLKAGFDQIENGQAMELDQDGLRQLFDDIQSRGRARYEASKQST